MVVESAEQDDGEPTPTPAPTEEPTPESTPEPTLAPGAITGLTLTKLPAGAPVGLLGRSKSRSDRVPAQLG